MASLPITVNWRLFAPGQYEDPVKKRCIELKCILGVLKYGHYIDPSVIWGWRLQSSKNGIFNLQKRPIKSEWSWVGTDDMKLSASQPRSVYQT